MTMDLQLFGGLFGGGGGGEVQTVEVPKYQAAAPSASAVSTESATDSDRQEAQKRVQRARGRKATVTGAGISSALQEINSVFNTEKKRTLGGA